MEYTRQELIAMLKQYEHEFGQACELYEALARDYNMMYHNLYQDKPVLALRLAQQWREESLVYRMNIEDLDRKLQAVFKLVELAVQ